MLAQTSHAVLCSAQWGCCCRAPSFFFLSVKCPPLPAARLLSPQFSSSLKACLSRSPLLHLAGGTKDEGARAAECLQIIFFLTSSLSLTMAFPWHLPPGNRWRERTVVRETAACKTRMDIIFYLIHPTVNERLFLCGMMLYIHWVPNAEAGMAEKHGAIC